MVGLRAHCAQSGQAKAERCAARGALGPFPYVAGTLEVLSMPLAEYLAEQFYVNRFVQRAHERNPPAWDIGEDTVLGMWVYESPFPITALHWGWDKIHDLCFKCMDKTQLWKPITTSSVVVHIKGHQVRASPPDTDVNQPGGVSVRPHVQL